MRKELFNKEGTIAHHLCKHQTKIFSCGEDIVKMKSVVLDLLQMEEIKHNPETKRAINIFYKLNGKHFLSTLVTYILGIKVSND